MKKISAILLIAVCLSTIYAQYILRPALFKYVDVDSFINVPYITLDSASVLYIHNDSTLFINSANDTSLRIYSGGSFGILTHAKDSMGIYAISNGKYGGYFTADNYAIVGSVASPLDTALYVPNGVSVFTNLYADTLHGVGTIQSLEGSSTSVWSVSSYANGQYSLSFGEKDTVNGQNSVIVGGVNNSINNEVSIICGGSYNTTLNPESFILGGSYNLDSSSSSFIIGIKDTLGAAAESSIIIGLNTKWDIPKTIALTGVDSVVIDSVLSVHSKIYADSFIGDINWDTLGAYLDTTNHGGSVRGGIEFDTLTGDETLRVSQDSLYQYINPNGADRNIYLDTTGAKIGNKFIIRNDENYSSNIRIRIWDMATSIDYISSMSMRTYTFNGNNWVAGDNATGISQYSNVALGYNARASGKGVAVGSDVISTSGGASVGFGAYGSDDGAAVGYYSNGYSFGVAMGYASYGQNYGVGLGSHAQGDHYGTALGYYAIGNYNGVAIGYHTRSQENNSIAKGSYSKCERYNEEWKCADGAAINKYGYGEVDWFAELDTSTTTEIFLGGVASNRFTILAKSVVTFSILVSALDTITGDGAGYKIEGAIKRDAANDSVSIVGSVTKTVLAEDDASWDVNVSADNVNKALIMTVASDTTNTVRWNAEMTYSEARY